MTSFGAARDRVAVAEERLDFAQRRYSYFAEKKKLKENVIGRMFSGTGHSHYLRARLQYWNMELVVRYAEYDAAKQAFEHVF